MRYNWYRIGSPGSRLRKRKESKDEGKCRNKRENTAKEN
jgi:hypothetical protein